MSIAKGVVKLDYQNQFVGNKVKQTFIKRGQEYTRKGYDLKVSTAESYKKKCDLLGECQSNVTAKLIEAFVNATGWGNEVKTPPVFEHKVQEHIKQAVNNVVKDMFPWTSQN